MRISVNLLKQFVDLNISDEEIIALVKKHIGEVDYTHNLRDDYKDIVVAVIEEKEEHPDADTLAIYKIDTGDEKNIQVVAGDKNLQIGDKVAYMKVGSKVPYSIYTEEEPFVVKEIKLRGIQSNGMMGSEKELNLGTNHSTVMTLPNDAPTGVNFSEYYELDDTIFEIENKALTNRGDLFGVLGIARELSAVVGKRFESPTWYLNPARNITHEKSCLKLEIRNDAESLCPRYTAVALDNVKVEDSPIWLKSSLIKYGIKPINNIVDITNYIAILIGQPLHAFDYDKIISADPNYKDSAYINIRMANHDEKVVGLDEKAYELDENIMVIADSTHPIAIAGVIGGKDTEVDTNTKRIVLESATFDKSNIRRTSMKLGVFTEAATRYKHFLDTEQCIAGLLKAVELIQELTEAKTASNIVDIYNLQYKRKTIEISVDRLNTVLGTNVSTKEVKNILENLEYKTKGKEKLQVTVPSWRRDIEIEEDIYEDIGRIYGFDNIEISLPKKEIKPPMQNKLFSTKRILRELLSEKGANETLSYSFTDLNSFKKCNLDSELAYKLKNPLSEELSLMRTSILQSLLPKAKENIERGINIFSMFEFNIVHLNNNVEDDKLPIEHWYLSLLLTNSKSSNKGSAYYSARRYLDEIFRKLNIYNIDYKLIADSTEQDLSAHIKNILAMFDPNTSAIISIGGLNIGVVGEILNTVKDSYKLPSYTAGFEIDINELSNMKSSHRRYAEQPIYPKFTQDLCYEVPTDAKYIEIENIITKILNSNDLWGTVECLDIYQEKDSSENKKITYRIISSNHQKTLTDKDIKQIVEKITKKISHKFEAKLV